MFLQGTCIRPEGLSPRIVFRWRRPITLLDMVECRIVAASAYSQTVLINKIFSPIPLSYAYLFLGGFFCNLVFPLYSILSVLTISIVSSQATYSKLVYVRDYVCTTFYIIVWRKYHLLQQSYETQWMVLTRRPLHRIYEELQLAFLLSLNKHRELGLVYSNVWLRFLKK
jgi:hypothetical protein